MNHNHYTLFKKGLIFVVVALYPSLLLSREWPIAANPNVQLCVQVRCVVSSICVRQSGQCGVGSCEALDRLYLFFSIT